MILKKVRFKNFLSYGGQWTEIDLINFDKTLIIGTNGSGKSSSILDTLCFGLYGKPYRNIKKDQIINSITRKQCVVEVEFDVASDQYKVIRGIKPNIFEIYKNDVLIDQPGSVLEFQNYLETNILKRSYKTFIQIDVLGSAKYTSFMELNTSQRREIIEDLLDLQVFSQMNVVTKSKILENKETIDRLEKELYSKETTKNKLNDILKFKADVFYKQILECNEKEINLNEKMIIESEALQKAQDEFDLYIVDDINEYLENKNKFSKGIIQFETRISQLDKEISFFKNNDSCPTCKQVIDLIFKNSSVEEKNQELISLLNLKEKLILKNDKNDKIIQKINLQLETKREYQKNIQYIENEISYLKRELDENKNKIKRLEKESTLEINTSNDDLNHINEEILGLKSDIDYNKIIKNKLLIIQNSLKETGVKALIIKEYIPIINQLINKYLDSMNFMVSFELSETFDETIKSRYRDEFSYSSFSEGEKNRISLALLLAFRDICKMRNSVASNILIMDEVLDGSLDNSGTDDFLNLLDSLSSSRNIFVISHNTDNITDKFDRILDFKKVKNFSVYEEK